MKLKKRLCIVIVNYKTAILALNCLSTLINQVDHKKDHIVIVDNNSGGEDYAVMKQKIENSKLSKIVTLILSPKNNGFSSGNNIGINAVDAETYILANTDTLFHPGAVSGLLSAAGAYPDAGIIGPRLEWPDGKPQTSCFSFHSPFSEIIKASGTGIVTKILKKYNVPLPIVDALTYPDWISFACVLIRSEVFEKIGFLDEGYFMYYEDVDYCRRTREAGFDILNWPYASVVHLQGQSSKLSEIEVLKKRLPSYYYKSRARYYTKFYKYIGFILCNIFWYIGRSISLIREILFGKNRTVNKYQYRDIWKK